jgi:ABC-2 type transport system ATP-binding protein
MSTDFALITEGLVKYYGKVPALRGVDLRVERAAIVGFLGPNGAGKTTTIRCMLDLIRPQAGTIRVLGLDPQADPVAVRRRVGYLPGELNLESNMTAEDTLRYFNHLRSGSVDWSYVRLLADRLALDVKIAIKNLSRGNKQKVGVIQALMARPELLLLDEPTSGLDPLMQQEVHRLVKEAQAEGTTVFFSSHIIGEVEAIAERIAIIRRGVIVEEAAPARLIDLAMRRVRVRFREAIDPQALTQLDGVALLSAHDGELRLQVEGEMDPLIKALAAFPVFDLETERPSLEEIFLTHYTDHEKVS